MRQSAYLLSDTVFCRTPTSLVGHGQPLERPRVSKQLDYEGEIALVIGKRGHRIVKECALEHIFGLTLCNEGTIRDWLRHGKYNNTPGKNFDKSGSLGPWIVTADEIDLGAPLELTTLVNGEVRQHDSTTRLMFPFELPDRLHFDLRDPIAWRRDRDGDTNRCWFSLRSTALARAGGCG